MILGISNAQHLAAQVLPQADGTTQVLPTSATLQSGVFMVPLARAQEVVAQQMEIESSNLTVLVVAILVIAVVAIGAGLWLSVMSRKA